MKKGIKIFLIALAALFGVLLIGFQWMKSNTKKLSPEQHFSASIDGLDVHIFYSSPSMRGRSIFGEVVPYGTTWRTGANEPTTISFSNAVLVNGEPLKAGKYTLWTIPEPEHWHVMFNAGDYPWGSDWGGKAAHQPDKDVLRTTAVVQYTKTAAEQLRIEVMPDPLRLEIQWEYSLISLPLSQP